MKVNYTIYLQCNECRFCLNHKNVDTMVLKEVFHSLCVNLLCLFKQHKIHAHKFLASQQLMVLRSI